MQNLAPYQSGLWLAEYLNRRCQLCQTYQSEPQPVDYDRVLVDNRLLSKIINKLDKGLLCPSCHDDISWLPAAFQVDITAGAVLSIQAATYYDYPIRQAIRTFKHHEDMTKLPLLVHVLRQLPRPKGCHGDNSVILPMPTTASRLIKRGFDPVTILSSYLSKYWQIPIWNGVKRIDSATSQQGLSRAERLTNLDNAFEVRLPPPVKRILLFDDVATTGASLQALARTLHIHHDLRFPPSPDSSVTTSNSNLHLSAYTLAHGSFDK